MISEFPKPARLPKPVKITEQVWPHGTMPVVSIFSWAYNHVDFIEESIESILMQETTFPVEIVIHDDASTDRTTEIIREYEAKYPQLFRNIIQTENQWSQGKSVMDPMFTAPRGEFIALTHGDDYWTSPHKLQKQVDQMTADEDLVLVGHYTGIVDESGIPTGEPAIPSIPWPKRIDLVEYLRTKYFGFQLSSWCFRSSALRGTEWTHGLAIGDVPLMMHLGSKGDIGFLPEQMSSYRRHGTSYWASNPGSWQARTNVEVYAAAAAHFRGLPRRLAQGLACNARFQLAQALYAEGKSVQALRELAKLCACRGVWRSGETAAPSLRTVLRRMKQMMLGAYGTAGKLLHAR